MESAEVTLIEAAEILGITDDELMQSRYRGLPPGNLGNSRNGVVYFRRVDLIPAPDRDQVAASTVKTFSVLFCPDCGFAAKTAGGLASHCRKHG